MRILVADPLAEDGVERLRKVAEVEVKTKQTEDQLIELVPAFDAMVVRSETKVTARVLEAGRNLKVVGRAGVGVDNIDVPAATRKGILVVNAPRGNIIAAAEHTIGLLAAVARNIPQADASVKRGEWTRSRFTGTEIRGKVLGLVGLGNIGSEVAKRAQGLELEVIAYDPAISPDRAEQFNVELVDLDQLLARSDFISLHVPLLDSTRHLLNAERLGRCKPTVRVINAARGGVVDEVALAEALEKGTVAGAAFDVFEQEPIPPDHPLLKLPNFIATPHVAASTTEAQTSVAFDVAEEVLAVLNGELPRYAVNAPSLPPEELAFLRPFADLAERTASLHLQLVNERVSEVELEFLGELAEHDTSLVTAWAIRGLVQPFTEDRINAVNARLIAANRGLKLTERRDPRPVGGYPSTLRLRVDGEEIEGTVLLGTPHILRIGPFGVDIVPRGHFLVSHHEDRPGVVGRVGTILGEQDINIASMQVGRDAPRGHAMMVLAVDDPVPERVLELLRGVYGLSELRFVSFAED